MAASGQMRYRRREERRNSASLGRLSSHHLISPLFPPIISSETRTPPPPTPATCPTLGDRGRLGVHEDVPFAQPTPHPPACVKHPKHTRTSPSRALGVLRLLCISLTSTTGHEPKVRPWKRGGHVSVKSVFEEWISIGSLSLLSHVCRLWLPYQPRKMGVGFYTLGVAAFAAIGTFFFGFDTVSVGKR